jgi:hypothetical protein
MKRLTAIVLSALAVTPGHALEFHVCTDANGIRHISNHAEFFNQDCTIRKDIYLQVLRQQHAELQDRYMLAESGNTDTTGAASGIRQQITDRMTGLLDHDKALEELHNRQQHHRDDVPFRTHLQTEGFQRLLELQ